jgi:hypothetical protein
MALLGNFIGGALGMQSATDYATAVDSASKLQALQRKNQFTKDMMNSAKPADPAAVRQVAPFNPDDAFGFDNLQQPGLRNIPPVVDNKGPDGQYDGDDLGNVTKPELAPKRNPDGSLVIEPSADGSLAQGDTVKRTDPYNEAANEFSLMPDLGPAVPDISNYNLAAKQAEQAKRNQLKGLLSGVSRRAGMRSGIAGRKMTGEEATATKWWASDEAFQLFYNRPEMLQEAEKIGAIEFAKRYTSQSDERASSIVSRESSTRTRKLIDGRIDGLKTQIGSNKVQRVYRMANDLGIDPFAAIAIFGIESDFGRNSGTSSKGAKGGMQVMPAQFKRLKTWFADPANRAAIESAFTMADGTVNKARVDYAIQTFSNMKMPNARGQGGNGGEIYGGLAQLIYNKAIGLPKNLWGAGYQANANKVLSAGAPLNVDDGNISNSDYNSAYVTLYNHIAATYGKQLSDVEMPYGVDLNTIAGSGVGQLVMAPVTNTAQTDTTGKDTTGTNTTGTNTTATEIVAEANKALDGTTQTVTNADGTKKESIATAEVTEPEQEIVKFLETPPNIGIEMQNLLDTRKLQLEIFERSSQRVNEQIAANNAKAAEYDQMARIYLQGGDIANYEKYSGLADGMAEQSTNLKNGVLEAQDAVRLELNALDNKMLLVQGAQALQDLSFGSTARAGAVLSAFSGLDIQVVTRSDGKFDITINGQRQGSPLTYDQVVDKLQSTYSAAFRESKQTRAAKRADQRFEKDLDTAAEIAKIEAEMQKVLTTDKQKAFLDLIKEEAKAAKGQMLSLGEGKALIKTPGGRYIFIDPAGRVADPNADSGYSRGFEKRFITTEEADALVAGTTGSGDPYKTK